MERSKPQLVVVNETTARDRDANEVNADFAAACEKAVTDCDRMAGFLIVTWDDEGFKKSILVRGKRFPIPSDMLPDAVREAAVVRVNE